MLRGERRLIKVIKVYVHVCAPFDNKVELYGCVCVETPGERRRQRQQFRCIGHMNPWICKCGRKFDAQHTHTVVT